MDLSLRPLLYGIGTVKFIMNVTPANIEGNLFLLHTLKMVQMTTSEHGGVVRDPLYR